MTVLGGPCAGGFANVLPKRLAKFGMSLAEEKTKLIPFGRRHWVRDQNYPASGHGSRGRSGSRSRGPNCPSRRFYTARSDQGVKPGSPVREIRTPGSEGGGGASARWPYEGTGPRRVPSRRTVGQPSDRRPHPTDPSCHSAPLHPPRPGPRADRAFQARRCRSAHGTASAAGGRTRSRSASLSARASPRACDPKRRTSSGSSAAWMRSSHGGRAW